MLLVDAVHAIGTVGGILLWMSAIAFILLRVFVEIRQNLAGESVRSPQLDLVAKTEKKPASKAPARRAA